MRVGGEELGGVRQVDFGQKLGGAGSRRCSPQPKHHRQGLLKLPPDADQGMQGGKRVLRHQGQRAPEQLRAIGGPPAGRCGGRPGGWSRRRCGLGGGSRPRMARAKVDLPQPLGPTSAADLARRQRTGRRHRTARSRPLPWPSTTRSRSITSTRSGPGLGEHVGHAAERADRLPWANAAAGRTASHQAPLRRKSVPARDHAAERGLRRGQTGTQKGERCFSEHRLAELQDGQRRRGRRDIGQDMAGEDLARRPPHQPGRLDVGQSALGAGERPGRAGIKGASAHGTEGHDDDERTGTLAPFDRGGGSTGARPRPALSAPGGATARRPRRASPADPTGRRHGPPKAPGDSRPSATGQRPWR